MKKSSGFKTKLIPPDDDFLPLAEYQAQFGDYHSSENRKRKHKKMSFNGVEGVAIPGEQRGRAWRIRREHSRGTKKDEVYEDGSDADGVEEGQAEEKYEDLKAEEEEQYEAAVSGMSMLELIAQHAKTQSMGQNDDAGQVEPEKNDANASMGMGRISQGRRRGGFQFSDSEDDRKGSRRSKGNKGGKNSKGGKVHKGSKNKGGYKAAAKRGGGGGAARSAPSPNSAKPIPAQIGAASAATSAAAEANDDEKLRGRKPRPLCETVAQQLEIFRQGCSESLHFGEQRATALRCIRRYIAAANTKLAGVQSAQLQKESEELKKQLMIVETAMKLFNEWALKKTLVAGVAQFKKDWDSLLVFCEADPVFPIRCNFMWELHLKVCAHDKSSDVANLLLLSRLQKHMDGDKTKLEEIQRKYVLFSILKSLESECNTNEVISAICQLCMSLLLPQHALEFSMRVKMECSDLLELVQMNRKARSRCEVDNFKTIMAKVPKQASAVPMESEDCVCLLRRFPKHGEAIMKLANECSEDQEKVCLLCEVGGRHAKSMEAPHGIVDADFLDKLAIVDTWYHDLSDSERATLAEVDWLTHNSLESRLKVRYLALSLHVLRFWCEDFAIPDPVIANLSKLVGDADGRIAQRSMQVRAVLQLQAFALENSGGVEVGDRLRRVVYLVGQWYSHAQSLVGLLFLDQKHNQDEAHKLFSLGRVFTVLRELDSRELHNVAWQNVETFWLHADVSPKVSAVLLESSSTHRARFDGCLATARAISGILADPDDVQAKNELLQAFRVLTEHPT